MKASIIGTIFAVLALVFTIAYFANSYQITQQNIQQANDDLKKAKSDMDAVVNTAIVHCQQNPGDACNVIMKQWQDKCQENDMKDIPSCHDGRIEAYFQNVNLNLGNSIPQTNIGTQTTASGSSDTSPINTASINALNSCSELLQSINDAREQLAGGIPLNMLTTSPNMAYNQPISDSQDGLKSCQDTIVTIKQQCVKDPSMSVCNDTRLEQLPNTIDQFLNRP